ncbi:hypothetical protein R0K18_29305, partial [Pantoea sp. SIMBA_133]
ADIKLFTSSLEKSIRSGAMSSRISQLNVIYMLYVGMTSRNYEESVVRLNAREKRWRLRKSMDEIDAYLRDLIVKKELPGAVLHVQHKGS